MTLRMYDSIEVSTIPSDAVAVAGYVGGTWPDFSAEVKAFPRAHHLSIAVNAGEDADCLDVENGDAVPADAPAWFRRQKLRGLDLPCFYSSLSEMPSVIAALAGAGIGRAEYRLWYAHYTYVPHQEAGADATQWTDRALGRNLDASECAPDFFGPVPVPPVPVKNPVRYARFQPGPFPSRWGDLNEREIVERYDGARQHPVRYGLYLRLVLRPRLKFLADRVANQALTQKRPDGRPSWNVAYRGYRYQQLIRRSKGQRFV